MGLLDMLTGPERGDGGSGRVPPLAKALAGLLSYGKLGSAGAAGDYSDRLEDFFKTSATGGPTAQGIAGALLTGGMMDLVRQFRGAGKGDTVDSWVAKGPNKQISPSELSQVLTEEQIAFLTQRTGMSREDLLAGLSQRLPGAIDQMTPEGRLPTEEELQRRI
jgi:uncharacterized protein YidB (DUF937 family)